MMYLMGFKNPECIKYVEINDPDLSTEVEKAVKKAPIDGSTAFFIGDTLKKGGFEFGKDYWMKKVAIKDLKGFIFKIQLLHKDCLKEIENHLSFSLANSIDNDTFFDCQDAGDIVSLLEQMKFKENKYYYYKVEYIDKVTVSNEILVGIEVSSLYRKVEEYYQSGDYELFKTMYPKVFDTIKIFDLMDRVPTLEEVKIYESKWKGFFERQGRIKDGLW